jgi:hypothetical protein
MRGSHDFVDQLGSRGSGSVINDHNLPEILRKGLPLKGLEEPSEPVGPPIRGHDDGDLLSLRAGHRISIAQPISPTGGTN